MTDFHLDTSGIIHMNDPLPMSYALSWSDLSPLAQGYVEALFAELDRSRMDRYRAAAWGTKDRAVPVQAAFGWLDPSALALVLKDCEAFESGLIPVPEQPEHFRDMGGIFWRARQDDLLPRWPPLHVFLSDEGKVCLREAS